MKPSNNVSRADNQQERAMMRGWIVGFVDGEGCFSINFVKQSDRKERARIRRGYKTGYQIAHEFAVVQGARSIESLKELQKFFGVGGVYINRRHDNHKEDLYRYSVSRRDDILKVIIPFFQKYPLRTSKRKDFLFFVECMKEIANGNHLTSEGAIRIARLCEQMNHKRSRAHIIAILRNQTSSAPPLKKGAREERVLSA